MTGSPAAAASLHPASAYTFGPLAARNPDLEVLLTDGLGGFALSSLAGVPTRCYSGLAVSQQPPVRRYSHLVSPLEILRVGGEDITLHALEIAPGVFEGRGLETLTGATIWDLLPEREQLVRGVRIRRRMCAPRHSGAVVYLYDVQSRVPVTLTLGGFFVDRDMHHVHRAAPRLGFAVQPGGRQVSVQGERETRVTLHLPQGAGVTADPIKPAPFSQRVYYRHDAARGEPEVEYTQGAALWQVQFPAGGGQVAVVVQGILQNGDALKSIPDPWAAYREEALRRRQLAEQAWQASGVKDEVVATLAVAADAYLVQRQHVSTNQRSLSVIAGYPWFADWGRDAMIALPGLTLVTGRYQEAREILGTFLGSLRRGLTPNNFHDDGTGAGYNTVDGALWLAVALERYARTTGDGPFARSALPQLRELLRWHVQGTDHGIAADPTDGLLRAGEPGVQLTWMDVKIKDWVVTPRHGKPVEIQALWLAALGAEARLSEALGEPPMFAQALGRAHQGFAALWGTKPGGSQEPNQHSEEPGPVPEPMTEPTPASPFSPSPLGMGGITGMFGMGSIGLSDNNEYLSAPLPRSPLMPVPPEVSAAPTATLADLLVPATNADAAPWQPDWSVRPNAAIALALPDTPATPAQTSAVIRDIETHLLTPVGLHTLSPLDPNYLGNYGGPQLVRDAAYHQGTVWPWPMGAFVEVLLSQGEVRRARAALAGLTGHLWEAGLGHVSEVFAGDSLTPGGCPFQAWSVAEVLRAHVLVARAEAAALSQN
ncbi:amylo-alpha-1,6-glucosidase [Deinococcus oregonensis]|uniref:Amylo-alpha-1,6-glucosidase n=1 Tax=Deinococcus oregonensis TaxID=1805970 RepID=A0ABV6B3F8_9DEIO